MTESAALGSPPSRWKLWTILTVLGFALFMGLIAVLSHLTTPRGRPVGKIDLLGATAPVLDIDTEGKTIRFSIDIVADTGYSEIHEIAEKGRLEIVAEAEGSAPLKTACATYGGSAHDTPKNRTVRPQFLRAAELECVIDAAGRSKVRLRAIATWPGGRPGTAVLTVRVGDQRQVRLHRGGGLPRDDSFGPAPSSRTWPVGRSC